MKTYTDASEMAQAVRQGHVSPQELVEDAIEKAKRLNPSLNAITSQRFEEALKETSERDFTNKAFAGVPIFLKDLGQEQKGQPSTSGAKLFANYRASKTDYLVTALEDLGFIILGRSNTPEFGFKNISDSRLHGSVNLPKDHSRNAGGSSGGAAALVASEISQLAPASDGGGSIRIPASFNGLIGLKPSRGRIPAGPGSYRGWQGASVHFALTKSVRDTRNLLLGLQAFQPESPFPLNPLSEKALMAPLKKPLRIGVYQKLIDGHLASEDSQQALQKASQFLEQEGHQVIALEELPFDMSEVIRDYYVMNAVETAAMFDNIEASLGRAVTKDDMETMTWAIYQAGKPILASHYSKALQNWDKYSAKMAQFHQNYDLLLTFTTNSPAPKHGALQVSEPLLNQLSHSEAFSPEERLQLIEDMFQSSLAINPYPAIANLTGNPAISLPTYETKEGLPMGIQFFANKGREDLLLALAERFEEANLLKVPQ
ncbi:amidase [Streptococcus ictaluri]|uniref:Amidase n=1 Tax=Streptococcus ictaluri 707-05 TaxID=764299 RepID=G5K2P1_9STRE|nr:amidase [Streptococcus ictaluri]EHI69555.1 amidase [Streptococcus ictaluri 707-05]